MKIENGEFRISETMDNSETLFLDALVQISFKTADKGKIRWRRGFVSVFAIDLATYNPLGLPTTILEMLRVLKKNTVYKSTPLSFSRAFGGYLPERFGVLIENRCGVDIELLRNPIKGLQNEIR